MTNCPEPASCSKPECGAPVGEDGYCTRCGTAAKPPAGPPFPRPVTIPQVATFPVRSNSSGSGRGSSGPSSSGRGSSGSSSRFGSRRAPLVSLPPVPADDHLVPVHEDLHVPEDKRFCPNPHCRQPVGRARNGQPGRPEGFCDQCGTEFSFRPPLSPGVLVGDGQFEIKGAIDHGGLGWVFRAWDRRVKHWVALKGLINPGDADKRRSAVAELAALAEAKHHNIVTVHTVVTHPNPRTGTDVDYIVMEYLNGPSLKELHHQHRTEGTFLPVAQVCGFALEVLAALEHLHSRGLLYCDLSAGNVIHSTVGVKLIDLGAVRRMDDLDSPVWGTRGYQDPQITKYGPSVATDLYPVGRMMALLSFPFPEFSTDGPIPDEVEVLRRHPSFHGLLRRATNPDLEQRFASAADMAEQLECVLREVRAHEEKQPFPAASVLFGPELRVVGVDPDTFPTEQPDTVAAALALPDPQVDPKDPHAGLLAAISADNPDETERVLVQLPDPSLETRLRVVRARIELRRPEVGDDLDRLGREQPDDWRVDWLRGLSALVDSDVETARERFAGVLDALPGEAAPKLALAFCAERAGDAELAARHYQTVWQTDRSYVSAAFGLARARFALDDRPGMVTTLETVPESSRYGVTARLCAVLARRHGQASGQPPAADFFTAAEQLHTLDLDERRRALAIVEVLETALDWERADRPWPHGPAAAIPTTLLGRPLSRAGVRDGLEAAYRELARLAPTQAERITLIDKANHHRNRSWT
ncbi:MAG: tetratricopeptide repeat protein [Pseudonocardiaceae bacterium]